MIEKLTPKQEKLVPKYLQKWLKVGYRTKTMDKAKVKKAVNFLYDNMKDKKRPKHIVYLDSPLACQLACNIIKNSKLSSVDLRSNLGDNLQSNLRSKLGSNLWSKLGSNLWSNLRSNLESNLWSNLDSNLWSNLWSNLRSNLQLNKLEYFSTGDSNWWQSWYWHYDFILNELMPEKKKDFKLYTEFLKHSQEYHMVWLFPEICFVSDFPKHIKLNDNKQLHSFDVPALHYRDGYALFYSNGIKMKKEYVETPADKITKDMYLKEKNADMKAEIVKKVGNDRLTELLDPTIIDTLKTAKGGKYEFMEIAFSTGQKHKFLKMNCPSSKKTHILGMDDSCKDAIDAYCMLNDITRDEFKTLKIESET